MLRALAVLVSLWAVACQVQQSETDRQASTRGGYLRVGIRGEPLTWNCLLATDTDSQSVSERTQAALVRVNRQTQEVEPELAESWSFSEDGKVLTFQLRTGVRFSDGEPFTAEDVAFTFRALHDPEVGSPLAETAKVEGEPLIPEVVDDHTVRFRLPRRTAVAERIFDSLYILPRHRLETPLEERNFVSAYGIGAMVENIVGLGPFVLERYLPGQRVVLGRNPHYWKKGPNGEKLPFLDGIIFEILQDSNARMFKFLAGELDIQGALLPEDFISLREKGRPDVRLRLIDMGPGMVPERLWFNLNPASPSVSGQKRSWFVDETFRRAISLAIDRPSMVEAVFHGLASAATGPVSPANAKWRNEAIEPPVLDREEARRLLRSVGFRWDEGGDLLGRENEHVRFALITNADNRRRTQMAMLIQDDLARLGIEMTLAPLDQADLLGRITRSFNYDACLLGITQTDPDPSAGLPIWLSRAPLHFWYPAQPQPATEWEARIDHLMEQQMLALDTSERKRLFDEVQAILAEKLPLIDLVVPHALLGVSTRVRNLKPTPYFTPPLWNCEEIYLSDTSRQTSDTSH
jgi:peptide/nickel transport system substrate-binding protein